MRERKKERERRRRASDKRGEGGNLAALTKGGCNGDRQRNHQNSVSSAAWSKRKLKATDE